MAHTPLAYASRGLVGLLTPQANTTVEPEFAILVPRGFAHLNARMVSAAPSLDDRLIAYFEEAAATVRQFANAPLGALALACTGSSYLVGREREARLIDELRAEFKVPACTAASAIVDALHALGARRVALASPYPMAMTRASAAYWAAQGFEVVAVNTVVATNNAAFHPIYSLGIAAATELLGDLPQRSDIDAVLMLGTGMPTLPPLLQANLSGGVPVLSSMLCLAWKAVDLIEPGTWPLRAWLQGEHWRDKLAAVLPAPTA